jgi:Leucine-rich repeat (LRR) protein
MNDKEQEKEIKIGYGGVHCLKLENKEQSTQINKFPLKMKNWIKVEMLELDDFNIEMIPSEVWMMTKLRHLSLNRNRLSFIPSELYCLSNLTQFGSQFQSNHTHLKSKQQTHSTSISQFIIKSIDRIS